MLFVLILIRVVTLIKIRTRFHHTSKEWISSDNILVLIHGEQRGWLLEVYMTGSRPAGR